MTNFATQPRVIYSRWFPSWKICLGNVPAKYVIDISNAWLALKSLLGRNQRFPEKKIISPRHVRLKFHVRMQTLNESKQGYVDYIVVMAADVNPGMYLECHV